MEMPIDVFERIVRSAHLYSDSSTYPGESHPFAQRDIHDAFPDDVRRLFDNGHYPQATFEAMKFIEEEVRRIANSQESGFALMMAAFNGVLKLNPGSTLSDRDEQEGFRHMFGGSMRGIRNPRGHNTGMKDDPDTCLDHLSFASMLIRRLDAAGLR